MSDTATNSSEDRPARQRLLPAVALLVLVAAAALWFGTRRSPAPPAPPTAAPAPAAAASSAAPAPLSASQVQRGLERAREDTQRDPKDAAAWAMLAHTAEMAGRFEEATQAYRQLLKLRPQDAQAHADFADALGVAQQGRLQGEPAKLIARALELEPTNLKALVLAGKEAFERGRYAEAIGFWERAAKTAPDERLRGPITTSIAEARALLSPGQAASGAVGQTFVAGRVTVAAALKDKVGPDDTVFIFARPPEGSRMPVALLKKRGRDLPVDFALDDTLAMTREARLSQHPRVIVGVRVSRRGDAIPAPGDLEGELAPVPLGSSGLALEISRERK
ncbi:MAG: tetratricopeptide repeat protein [Rubrivivax sp.]|nr:tetratricopeptide repeat protein [Rubrivivax sp.]